MPNSERAQRYLDRASALRRLAEETQNPENRIHFATLAASFERLAKAVKTRLKVKDLGVLPERQNKPGRPC